MKKYKFSIVMACYNSELYLDEAIQSLIDQTIGFIDNVQLILCDDGSVDKTGMLCDTYKEKYPENIVVIHQKNQGVSAARNAGLPYVEGEFINFMDSDDKLSKETLKNVYEFFKKHTDEIDLVSIPVRFFDGASGGHLLNYKFNKGTRIINLREEFDCVQNSLSSAFITKGALNLIRFDIRLSYLEDMHECMKVLLNKCKIGVLCEACYYYRRHSKGNLSAVQTSLDNEKWYLPPMKYANRDIIEYSLTKFNVIEKFVQYMVMYDLEWRLNVSYKKIIDKIGTEDAKKYKELMCSILKKIDDDIILSQKFINGRIKWLSFALKYEKKFEIIFEKNKIYICVNGIRICSLNDFSLILEFLEIKKKKFIISGHFNSIPLPENNTISLVADVNGKRYECIGIHRRIIQKEAFDKIITMGYEFLLEIDQNNINTGNLCIQFYLNWKQNIVPLNNVMCGKFFPLNHVTSKAYGFEKTYLLYWNNNKLILRKNNSIMHILFEIKYLYSLIFEVKHIAARKAFFARLAYYVLKCFKRRSIWLLSDRINKADDNGEALFKYLNENKISENTYFVLRKDSTDYPIVKKYGKMLNYSSWKHKIIHLLADTTVSAAADDFVYNPFLWQGRFYHDILVHQKRVFLQHGITKDDLSDWLNKYNKNLSLFITAAQPEYKSIVQGKYFYDSSVVKLTGFPRYDRLQNVREKIITIMPTWRNYLVNKSNKLDTKDGIKRYDESFKETIFFQFYDNLLNNKKFLLKAKELGYKIQFMPHPNLISYIDWFHHNDAVTFCSIHTKYREIFNHSSLILTDYSSVAFDFAYLRKPVVYCQFDKDIFFTHHTYTKGYFNYERDGFGEVTYDLNSLVDCLIDYMENDCQLKDKYKQRIDNFFAYNDKKNCERVYNAIKSI
ncbi:bifunctional glycosyltransferase/CDP-glycerol:glycerophosphate glycerophosphotransferase [Megasphaera elsdenii]|uniref:bifunctional glycosyltransferase/CDP-glycerol:glycerophosphate glycerophosphotransferase n=1 Tax=Megasphaera elsdenii TaxID=907 RepID=UPI00242DF31B|nr:CDP-glycerol glycerophosphotransferase family protein [Megasphaera elsdenii]